MVSALRRIRYLQVEGDVLVWLIHMPNSYSNLPRLRLVQCRLLLFVNLDLLNLLVAERRVYPHLPSPISPRAKDKIDSRIRFGP